MFGALVCLDAAGNEVVLRAFSGSYDGKWNRDGWAPPLFDEEKYKAEAAYYDDVFLEAEADHCKTAKYERDT